VSASSLDSRIAHLEGGFEQVNHRLGSLELRMSNVERKIDQFKDSILSVMESRFGQVDQRFGQMDQRFAQMDQKFNWVFGLIVVSILIPLVERFALR
jgi:hypothetical protein